MAAAGRDEIDFVTRNKVVTRVQSVLNSKEATPQVLFSDVHMSPTDFNEHKVEFVYEPLTKEVVISFFRNEINDKEPTNPVGGPDSDMDEEPAPIVQKTQMFDPSQPVQLVA